MSISTAPGDTSATWNAVSYGNGRFVALNDAGQFASSPVAGPCGPTIPSSPQQVSGNVHSQMVWTYQHPPTTAGGAPVDSYKVSITDGVTTHVCYAPQYYEPNCKIYGLTNRRVYRVTTQAHNRFGFSTPSDPEFVIPVGTWSLQATTAVPVVSDARAVQVQLTGVLANAEGIYPISVVTIHFGTLVTHCYPNVFGECLANFSTTVDAPTAMSASYTGYGHSYQSPVARDYVSHVTVPSQVKANAQLTVGLHGGVPKSTARIVFAGHSATSTLDASGNGSLIVTAPSTPGTLLAAVNDFGVALGSWSVVVR